MDKGYYLVLTFCASRSTWSQSTIKMDKGYYTLKIMKGLFLRMFMSQSTIKMDKGYYRIYRITTPFVLTVAIHNKNGQGLLQIVA